MNKYSICIENLYKEYQLGSIGYGTLREDLQSWWAKINNRADPNTNIGTTNNSNRILALDNISLKIKKGERLGIIGNNGAGKTTLLKILSRIASPTKGTLKIKGNIASLIAVGTGFHSELTGRENIYLNGSILGLTKKQISERFEDIVKFSGVENFIDTPVKRYSSGMTIRLGFSVAAHLEPEILLVDEVLAVGDAGFREKAIGKMKDASKENSRTILFVSHNMTAVKALCDRVLVLKNGKMDFLGNPEEGIKRYLSKKLIQSEGYYNKNNERVELRAIRIRQEDVVTSTPTCSKNFYIEIDYFNKEEKSRRCISINLKNEMGQYIFSSGNQKSSTATYDKYYDSDYNNGLYRTICTIPENLLNPGLITVDVFIQHSLNDYIIAESDIFTFEVLEHESWRTEYLGEWIGAVRPKLSWKTEKIN